MNKKLVVVWIFVIVIFVGLGLFGYLNQDLLVDDSINNAYVPVSNTNTTNYTCTGTIERGSLSYKFSAIDDNIKSINIVYTATSGTVDDYTSAVNLSNASIKGMTVVLSGEINNFSLVIMVNMSSLDTTSLATYQDDLDKLSIVVKQLPSYTKYIESLSSYTCNLIK
ncbi:MAG TPA: hypothetical protein PLB45_01425 [Bacilli bacterium]|nr:hypothetical protein [Bacilli bacterium]HPZ23848.1 hypothetical protein [Bacilli bacterium]HQC83518.1 hypothetical protein [Bacilli bacterium]